MSAEISLIMPDTSESGTNGRGAESPRAVSSSPGGDLLVEALQLIRVLGNRYCADCSAPLGDSALVCASLVYGVWLCNECGAIHRSLEHELHSDIKSMQGAAWSDQDIQAMKKYESNFEFNNIYEKHVPSHWIKVTAQSTVAAKTLWIRAKYGSKMFFLPVRAPSSPASVRPIKPPKRADSGSTPNSPNAYTSQKLFNTLLAMSPMCCTRGADFSQATWEEVRFDAEVTSTCPLKCKTSQVPENCNLFTYPECIFVTPTERSPHFFTIVLTDVDGKKQYGGVLHFDEILTPNKLAQLLGHKLGSPMLPKWPILYVRKALVILSHYPLFNLLHEVLQALYRISMSSAPLPIERYVQSVIQETPLPPPGKIAVSFSLGDRRISAWRHPINKLPTVDFSFRPLFMSLSVDHIMYIFGALCNEVKVAICSSNISLLTPVMEAMLSFLFPFVWQGAYIPVLPIGLCEILDAPVPFFVGITSRYLSETDPSMRPDSVIFVDLDNDLIYHGDSSKHLTSFPNILPEKVSVKLRAKLVEFGGSIYRAEPEKLWLAGVCFPDNDHLVPIDHFANEAGILFTNVNSDDFPAARDDPTESGEADRCYANGSKSSAPSKSILNSCNNIEAASTNLIGMTRGFNARELRGAFLRFFVTVLLHYRDYIKRPSEILAAAQKGRKNFSENFKMSKDKSPGNFPDTPESDGRRRSISVANAVISVAVDDSPVFDKASFLKDHPGNFYVALLESQMFSVFIREAILFPDQTEIKFFTEAILDKLNRSKTTIVKMTTPFLSDRSHEVSQTYIPPEPSNFGVDSRARFSYSSFPDFVPTNFAPLRSIPNFVASPELGRQRDVKATQQLIRSASLMNIQTVGSNDDNAEPKPNPEVEIRLAHIRLHTFVRTVMLVQSMFRAMKPRRDFQKALRAVRSIQSAYRIHRWRKVLGEASFQCCVRLQTVFRGYMARMYFNRLKVAGSVIARNMPMLVAILQRKRRLDALIAIQKTYRSHRGVISRRRNKSAILIQRVYRGYKARFQRALLLRRIIGVQATVRRILAQRRCDAELRELIARARECLFALWSAAHVPLIERSNFWVLVRSVNHLHLAILTSEVKRCAELLQLKGLESLSTNDILENVTSAIRVKNFESSKASLGFQKSAIAAEKTERDELYDGMKREPDESRRMNDFKKFGIASLKKRKRTLADMVWKNISFAEESATAVRHIVGATTLTDMEWYDDKKNAHMRSGVFFVARDAMLVLTAISTWRKKSKRSQMH